jgi:hypothetical protein
VEISEVTLGELFPAANPTSLLEAPDAAAADPSTEKLAKDAVRDHCGFQMPVLHAHKVWQGETFIFRDDAGVDLFVAVVVDRNRTRLRLCQIPQW